MIGLEEEKKLNLVHITMNVFDWIHAAQLSPFNIEYVPLKE